MFIAELWLDAITPEILFESENLGTLITQVAEIAFEETPEHSRRQMIVFRDACPERRYVVAVGVWERNGNVFTVREVGCDSVFTFDRYAGAK